MTGHPPPPAGTRAERRAAAADAGFRAGFASLDEVCLETTCRARVLTLQTAPQSLRGTLRSALRAGLLSATVGCTDHERVRGWKLFLLAPRMLLYREPGVSRVPPAELDRRNRAFQAGDWLDLIREAAAACTASAPGPRRNVASDDQSGPSPPSRGSCPPG